MWTAHLLNLWVQLQLAEILYCVDSWRKYSQQAMAGPSVASSNISEALVDDDFVTGTVDFEGRPARRSQSGYWRSALFIMGVGVAERFAFVGISSNLITYLMGPMGRSPATAAASVNSWSGCGALLPLLGAFMADSFLGCYWTIVFASILYILAFAMLTVSAMLNYRCSSVISRTCSPTQIKILDVFFFLSLYLVALAEGGHKPCIVAFGADQFDGENWKESKGKSSFFNWWYFGLCAGPLFGLLALNYIQDNLNWALGFGIPCISMAFSLVVFLFGTKIYRYSVKETKQHRLSRIWKTMAKIVMPRQTISWLQKESSVDSSDHQSSQKLNFLETALLEQGGSVENGDISMRNEVEEAKAILRLLPIWFTSLAYATALAQCSTLFTEQGVTMDTSIGSRFHIPPASLQYLIGISIILSIPIYDRVFIPIARSITSNPSGITKLQRIGIGMILCIISMAIAALVERRRLHSAALAYDSVSFPEAKVPMTFWWLLPQYILFGIANVFTMIGLQELFYDQMPCEFKSIGLSLFYSIFGSGSLLSSFLIAIIEKITGCEDVEGSWFSRNLNQAHLDYFYWLLAALNVVEFIAFVCYAKSYKYSNRGGI